MKALIVSRHTYVLFLVLLVSLPGCSAPVAPTLSPTNTLTSLTFIPVPTIVPSPMPTPELPTDTPTPSPIPATRTPSPTPVPTMTADEEYAFVSEMLRSNGGCRLPCWWGFTPGKTPWQITRAFFVSRGVKIWDYGGIQDYTIVFDIPDHDHNHDQVYFGKDGTLDRITIHALPPYDDNRRYMYGDPRFAEDWRAYMLPQILEVYGPPSQVFLGTGGAPWRPFDLLVFYPEQGFLVEYHGLAEQRKGKRGVCVPTK